MQSLEERFWSQVDTSGGPDACWEWTGYRDKSTGYGKVWLRLDGMWVHEWAHRVAYALGHNALVKGMQALHTCDNRLCCNPAHLFAGTQLENMQDCKRKGRVRNKVFRGELNGGGHKLTEKQVLEIKQRLRCGNEIQAQMAREYGVSKAMITRIKHGMVWGWL